MRTACIGRAGRIVALSALGVALLLSLGGCSSVGRALGMGKQPPDEFAVVTHAPLAMPPEFTLRPPEPGAPRPQEMATDDRARQAVFGVAPEETVAPEGTSPGEATLLAAAGADRADPAIRDVLDREAVASAKPKRSFTDRLMFWRGSEPEPEQVMKPAQTPAPSETASAPAPRPDGEAPSAESAPPAAEASSKGGFFSRIWPF